MSTPVSQLSAWITLPDGSASRCEHARVTLDRKWAPVIDAEVRLPAASGAAALDPRGAQQLVRVLLRRQWDARQTLADLTATWTGKTLADLTAAWTGKTLADLTAAWRQDWESGSRDPDELTAYVSLRSVVADEGADTVVLTARSAEVIAQTSMLSQGRPAESLSQRIVGALTSIGLTITDTSGLSLGDTITVPAVAADPTTSVWDHLSTLANSANAHLWCDTTNRWRLDAVLVGVDPTAGTPDVTIARAEDWSETVDVDGDYADALAVTCSWTTTTGARQTMTVYVSTEPADGVHKWARQTVDSPIISDAWPGPGSLELQARLAALVANATTVTFTAPADVTLRPDHLVETSAPLPARRGRVSAVTFNIPEDTMTVTLASVVKV